MTPETLALLEAAMALPEDQRGLLLERLLETLSDDVVEMSDVELHAELERRREDMESGRVTPIPWLEFRWEES
jgi:putative addiction module component (TIGR02574 family)